MDDNQQMSPDVLLNDLIANVDELKLKLNNAEEKVMQLELALLQSRDFAIGSSAQAGEARANIKQVRDKYVESERLLGDANTHIASHLAHIERLELTIQDLPKLISRNAQLNRRIENLHQSATWRIGNAIMLPARAVRRILGKS